MTREDRPFSFGRFLDAHGNPFVGVVTGDSVQPIAALTAGRISLQASLSPLLEDWSATLEIVGEALARGAQGGAAFALSELKALAPLPDARQIFCTGANYGRHVVEMIVALGVGAATEGMDAAQRRRFGEAYVARQKVEGAPYIFMKPVTAISGPTDPLELPGFSPQIDWELELAAVMGPGAYRVDRSAALGAVAGYMIANDLTARDKVKRNDPGAIGPDWLTAKGAPGFLPTGPLLVPARFVPDPQALRMRLAVNGAIMQDDSTSDMTFDIARQIEFLSGFVRLLAGDIICTGSPAGNGIARGLFLKPGDVMEAEIEGLGRQVIACRSQT